MNYGGGVADVQGAGEFSEEEHLGREERAPGRRGRLSGVRLPRLDGQRARMHAPRIALALTIVAILIVGARYWSDHRRLSAVPTGYTSDLSDVSDPVLDHGIVSYAAALAHVANNPVSLREVTFPDPSVPVVKLKVGAVEVPLINGKAKVHSPLVRDGVLLTIGLRIDPLRCRALSRVILVRLASYGRDRRMHHQDLALERYASGHADQLLDPAMHPELCAAPTGSAMALPQSRSARSGAAFMQQGGFTTASGAYADFGFQSLNVTHLGLGYLVDEYGTTSAYSSSGKPLWTHLSYGSPAANADGTRVALAGPSRVVVVDARTGLQVASLKTAHAVNQVHWAGSSILLGQSIGGYSPIAESPQGNTFEAPYTLVYRWDPPSGSLGAVNGAIPDGYGYINDSTTREQGLGRECTLLLAYAANFSASNFGGGIGNPTYLATVSGGQGQILADMNSSSTDCPALTQVRGGTDSLFVAIAGSFSRSAFEYRPGHGIKESIRLRGLETLYRVAREDDTHWLAMVSIEPNPNSYRTKPQVSDERYLVLVRCTAGGSCQRVKSGMPLDWLLIG